MDDAPPFVGRSRDPWRKRAQWSLFSLGLALLGLVALSRLRPSAAPFDASFGQPGVSPLAQLATALLFAAAAIRQIRHSNRIWALVLAACAGAWLLMFLRRWPPA
jgi:hypothetical protein